MPWRLLEEIQYLLIKHSSQLFLQQQKISEEFF